MGGHDTALSDPPEAHVAPRSPFDADDTDAMWALAVAYTPDLAVAARIVALACRLHLTASDLRAEMTARRPGFTPAGSTGHSPILGSPGVMAYRRGCRCDRCRAAMSAYQRTQREQRRLKPVP